MSTLHHESILEDCLVEAEENFRVHNKLTQKQLDELLVRSEGVRLAITKQAPRTKSGSNGPTVKQLISNSKTRHVCVSIEKS